MGRSDYLRNEKGLVLVVALMLLITLTVIGLAAMSTTSTEIKISGNERINAQAFHVAEAGVKEVLYRMALPDGVGTIDVAQGGSQVTVEGGYSFDASIADPGWSPADCVIAPCPNPNWAASIFFAGNEPADPNADSDYTRTILPNNVWGSLSYATGDTNTPELAVIVRYAKESDYNGAVLNADGDDLDLVFYDSSTNPPVRSVAGPGVNGTADFNPPGLLNNNDAILIVTSTGRLGTARKAIAVETTRFATNPDVRSAVTVGHPLQVTGSALISGFNHLGTTTRADETNIDRSQYDNNGCNNYSEMGISTCSGADPDAGEDALYSGSVDPNGGHLSGVLIDDTANFDGSGEIWGGKGVTVGWLEADPTLVFPEIHEMLGLDQTTTQNLLDNANVTDANADSACPIGLTYIQNSGGLEYEPADGCMSGSGIMVVEGDLDLPSGFEFRGLVYVKGDAHMRGNVWILGGVAVKGENLGTTEPINLMGGSTQILYSRQTLETQIQSALTESGYAFRILSWKES